MKRLRPILLTLVISVASPVALGDDLDFAEHVLSSSADAVTSVHAADMDGDGQLDLLCASANDDSIACYRNLGGARADVSEFVVAGDADGASSVSAADLDGDGDMDVLAASRNDDTIAWYENVSGKRPTFLRHVITTNAQRAASVAAADLDGDGDVDVLSASSDDHKIAWYESNGQTPPAFTEHVVSLAAFGALSVGSADMDGDGDLDILAASTYGADKIAWHENDGGVPPLFTERIVTTTAVGSTSVAAGDLDGDGDIDLVSSSGFDDKIAWYENDGMPSPAFSERVIALDADFARMVTVADIDGDGDLDVASASSSDDTIAWYDNDGHYDPSFTKRVVSNAMDGATTLVAADLDGDGHVDLAAGAGFADRVSWFENLTTGPIGWCPADLDGTGEVGFHDMLMLFQAWGPCMGCPEDLDGTGHVGPSDLILLFQAWGGCG